MTEALPFNLIVQALQRACFQAQTGRFHIVTSDNHKATFVLDGGTIIGITYRIRRGAAALEAILNISSGRWRFEQRDYPPLPDSSLPDTRSILQQLKAPAPSSTPVREVSTSAPQPKRQSTSQSVGRSVPATAPLAYLPEAVQADLITLLSNVIGPIAGLLVPTTLKSAPDAETALTLLSQEIPDAQAAKQFRQDAWALLNGA